MTIGIEPAGKKNAKNDMAAIGTGTGVYGAIPTNNPRLFGVKHA